MSPAISDLTALLRTLEPELHDGAYAYCVVPPGTDLFALSPVATVAEAEGLTVILPEAQAIAAGFSVLFRAAWITLTVHSDLQAVGLTAAFATALADRHKDVVVEGTGDHIATDAGLAQGPAALAALKALQQGAQ